MDDALEAQVGKLRAIAATLRVARDQLERTDPRGRDLSIAITHIEDAIFRLWVGTRSVT